MDDLISRRALLYDMVGFADGWMNPAPAGTYEELVKQQVPIPAIPLDSLCELLDNANIPPLCLNLCMKQHYKCPAQKGSGYADCWNHFLTEWMERTNEH